MMEPDKANKLLFALNRIAARQKSTEGILCIQDPRRDLDAVIEEARQAIQPWTLRAHDTAERA